MVGERSGREADASRSSRGRCPRSRAPVPRMTELLAVLVAYLLGSLPFGYWLPLLFRGEDIRTLGSGTSVRRTCSASTAAGWAPRSCCSTSARVRGGAARPGPAGRSSACWPACGGNGPRPARVPALPEGREDGRDRGGATFALAPLAALSCVGVWIAVFLLTRYASVASIATALALVLFVWLFGAPWPVVASRSPGRRRSSSCTATTCVASSRARSTASSPPAAPGEVTARARPRASSGARPARPTGARFGARRPSRSARRRRRAGGSSRS